MRTKKQNWNVVAVCSASGTVVERMKYDAFGSVSWSDGAKAASTYAWNRTFTGQVGDNETLLMLYRMRYFNTLIGRWTSRDPIGYEAEDENLYRYVHSSVTGFVDPYGLQNECQPPLWFCGMAYGSTLVGQKLLYPVRALGVTNLIGAEGYLQKCDRSLELLHNTLYPVSNNLEWGTDIAANTAAICTYSATGLSVASKLGITEIGNANSLQSAFYITSNELTVAGTTGTLFPASYLRNPSGTSLIEVSRWGRESIKDKDWVMKGKESRLNYFKTGKWQPNFFNKIGCDNEWASYAAGNTYIVPNYMIRSPQFSFTSKDGIFAPVKSLLGQRIFDTSLMPPNTVGPFQYENVWKPGIIILDREIMPSLEGK